MTQQFPEGSGEGYWEDRPKSLNCVVLVVDPHSSCITGLGVDIRSLRGMVLIPHPCHRLIGKIGVTMLDDESDYVIRIVARVLLKKGEADVPTKFCASQLSQSRCYLHSIMWQLNLKYCHRCQVQIQVQSGLQLLWSISRGGRTWWLAKQQKLIIEGDAPHPRSVHWQ